MIRLGGWPRSTLGRTLLLLTALLLVSQGTVYVLYHRYVLDPAADRFAQLLWRMTTTLENKAFTQARIAGFDYLPPNDKPGLPPNDYFLRRTANSYRRISPGASFRVTNDKGHRVWIWIRPNRKDQWIGFPMGAMDFVTQGFLFAKLGLLLLFTLVGAWLIVRQINRPLSLLSKQALRIGKGEVPAATELNHGPVEVQALGAAIQRMAEDIHRLHEDRSLLLTGISHELRTPLSRLLLTLHLDDAELLKQKSEMQEDVAEMDEVLDKFLTLVRSGEHEQSVVTAGQAWLRRMSVLAQTKYHLDVRCQRFGASSTGPSLIRVRPLSLERVFRNLFDNAKKYGSGVLDMTMETDGSEVRFLIVDRGTYLEAPIVHRMNSGESARQPGHGMGIGLMICHRIMALHKGSLHFTSEDGLAATICLPRVQDGVTSAQRQEFNARKL
jgi:two-component system osmolarity sensor histidine kinase EnvZ